MFHLRSLSLWGRSLSLHLRSLLLWERSLLFLQRSHSVWERSLSLFERSFLLLECSLLFQERLVVLLRRSVVFLEVGGGDLSRSTGFHFDLPFSLERVQDPEERGAVRGMAQGTDDVVFVEGFGQLGEDFDDVEVEGVGFPALLWRRRRCFLGLGERRGFRRFRGLGCLGFASGGPPEQLQHLELGAVAGVDEVQGYTELLVQDPLALLVFVAFHGLDCNTTREGRASQGGTYIDEVK